ncbi:hypothetical protein [Bacillus bingmayongensis]|uniref:Group-specific protein n=1 Tax=Bacillus bingmayongensis TaxID=1150157 RepID=A0ABU5JXY8_9BACI|nr:hypothetical protein [Bacillus bingmayongensis]MBY0595513.1 hypothetical protein [Bacillus bingmayongensis]MDZ5608318.1 hypothetical protein [Bacillus pseudomycoides]
MKVLLSIRFWIALMSCIILCSGLFLTLEYTTTSKAAENSDIAPYELLYAKPNTVPQSSLSSKEKRVIKGMIITEASSHHDLDRIAKKIKEQYKNQKIDEIILSIHNKNTGKYEEDLPYEPLSKGTISIIYNSQSHSNAIVRLNE